MKKKLILLFISSLLSANYANELTFFQSAGSSELLNRIIETSEHNISINDKNISSTEVSIDTFFHNTESHNAIKGKKIFTKKLRKPCDISAADFSGVHTQDEWEAITEAGTLKDEILQICPEIEGKIKQQWLPSLYQFLYEYASDSGNIPSCSD